MNSAFAKDDIAVSVIDALTSQICVVDPRGVIFAVNRAWKQFTAENSSGQVRNPIGVNYLNVCRHSVGPASEEASPFVSGLSAVLRGEREFFQIEYPCHSPKEMRWFLARVSPLRRRSASVECASIGAVVSHMNITDRKLAELDCARLAATDPLTGRPQSNSLRKLKPLNQSPCRPKRLLTIARNACSPSREIVAHHQRNAQIR